MVLHRAPLRALNLSSVLRGGSVGLLAPRKNARARRDFSPGTQRRARYFLAIEAALSAYFFVKRSTRPAVSISFCLPVKNGWQLEQISVRIALPLMVERVSNVLPQAQCTVTTW